MTRFQLFRRQRRLLSGSCQCPVFRPRARKWSMVRCVPATSPISASSMPCWRFRAKPSFPRTSARWPISTSISMSARAARSGAILIKPRGAGEDAAGRRDQGDRQASCVVRLRHRLCRGGDRPICRARCTAQVRPPATRPMLPSTSSSSTARPKSCPRSSMGSLREGGRLVGVFAMTQPRAGDHRDAFPWRFREPGAVRRRAPVLPGMERLPAFVF